MDRLDAMKVFVVTLDEGSLAAAGRKLGRSPAAVSRAIAFLEARVGTELLHRTTRSIKLSDAGERYAATCRRVLAELEDADVVAAGERAVPRGTVAITAPNISGELVLRPILDAFLEAFPTVSARVTLMDRHVNLIEEGIDVALRIGHLEDSSMIAMRVGEVRRVVVAAPRYLKQHPRCSHHWRVARHRRRPRQGLSRPELPRGRRRPLDQAVRRGRFNSRPASQPTAPAQPWRPRSAGLASRGCFPIRWPSRCSGESSNSCSPLAKSRRCRCM